MAKPITTAELQLEVGGLLTTHDMCRMLKRSQMMIHNYRRREHDPLPTVMLGRRVGGYVKGDVIAWARRNGIHIHESKRG